MLFSRAIIIIIIMMCHKSSRSSVWNGTSERKRLEEWTMISSSWRLQLRGQNVSLSEAGARTSTFRHPHQHSSSPFGLCQWMCNQQTKHYLQASLNDKVWLGWEHLFGFGTPFKAASSHGRLYSPASERVRALGSVENFPWWEMVWVLHAVLLMWQKRFVSFFWKYQNIYYYYVSFTFMESYQIRYNRHWLIQQYINKDRTGWTPHGSFLASQAWSQFINSNIIAMYCIFLNTCDTSLFGGNHFLHNVQYLF